jgi:membrane associated rhomboid family serine protease
MDIPLGYRGGPPGGFITEWLAFDPQRLFMGAVWQPFTYMFLHGGLMHLFLNMMWLYFFGPEVERVLGTAQFLRFYILCGAAGVFAVLVPLGIAAVAHGTVAPAAITVVGASGAVMGTLIAYAIVNPDRTFFMFPLPIPINARALVIIVIVMNLLSVQDGSTSVATHFGGMAVAFAYMKLAPRIRNWTRSKKPPKGKPPTDGNIGDAIDNIFRFEDKKKWR